MHIIIGIILIVFIISLAIKYWIAISVVAALIVLAYWFFKSASPKKPVSHIASFTPIPNIRPKFVRYNPFTGNEYTIFKQVSDFIAIDFETANELPLSICAVGVAIVENNYIVETKHWYIKPRELRFTNTHIHGITPDMVRNSFSFDEFWDSTFCHMITNKTVVAYNASFDIGCLENTLMDYGVTTPPYAVIDALRTARDAWPNLNNHKLSTVANHLRLSLDHHNAPSDAIACANILLTAQAKHGHVPLIKCLRTQYPTTEVHQALSIISGAKDDISEYLLVLAIIDKYLSNPFIDGKEKSVLHRKCGEAYLRCDEINNAIVHFEKALEYNPRIGVAMTLKKIKKEYSIAN